MQNYYDVLGISDSASDLDIKKAHRQQARLWHPDFNNSPEATARFKEVQEANEYLSQNHSQAKESFEAYENRPQADIIFGEDIDLFLFRENINFPFEHQKRGPAIYARAEF